MASLNETIVLSDDEDSSIIPHGSNPGSVRTNGGGIFLLLPAMASNTDPLRDELRPTVVKDVTEERGEADIDRVLAQLESSNIGVDRHLAERFLAILEDLGDRVQRTVRLLTVVHSTGPVKEREGSKQLDLQLNRVAAEPEAKRNGSEEAEPNHWEESSDDDLPISVRVHKALLKDVEKIMEVFPDVDRREVYAYLEAHIDREDRVEVVVEELVNGEVPPAAPCVAVDYRVLLEKRKGALEDLGRVKRVRVQADESEPGPSHSVSTTVVEERTSNGTSVKTVDDPTSDLLESQCALLKDLFPDADPDFWLEFLSLYNGSEELFKQGIEHLLETRKYPRLKDKLEFQRKEQMMKVYTTRHFTPDEILQWGIDPLVVYYDTTKPVGIRYRELTTRHLQNVFPHLKINYLRKVLFQTNFHFLPSLRQLEKLNWTKPGHHYKRQPTPLAELTTEPDEQFYKELAFSRVEREFVEYVDMKKRVRETKVEEARASGTLISCNCCFDDEFIADDTVECPNQHTFCMECVRRGMEVAIGQGKTTLDCMTEGCKREFSLQILQLVLSPNVFSNLLKKIQATEIELAGIPDLETCSFCSFAAIMPNQEDKVFRCLNPDCLKETCRLCKEPNHVPLKCTEVEKSSEVKMRTYIENKMSEALMRECYTCKKRFTKSEGCNMMTCVCGAKMCYVCRQPIKDYNHFSPTGCPQISNTEKLHVDEVNRGAEEAKRQFVDENPEMVGKNLKFDPTKGTPAMGAGPTVPIPLDEHTLLFRQEFDWQRRLDQNLAMYDRLQYLTMTAHHPRVAELNDYPANAAQFHMNARPTNAAQFNATDLRRGIRKQEPRPH